MTVLLFIDFSPEERKSQYGETVNAAVRGASFSDPLEGEVGALLLTFFKLFLCGFDELSKFSVLSAFFNVG